MSTLLSETPPNVVSGNILAVTRRNVEIEELDAAIGKLILQMNARNYQRMVMLLVWANERWWQ